jgi:hypothetical protein
MRRDCKGDPESPLSHSEITEKAQMVMGQGGQKKGSVELIKKILDLPQAPKMPRFPLHATGEPK